MKKNELGAFIQPRRWMIQLVRRVAGCYVRMRSLEPVVAQNCDDTPGARSMRWSEDTCLFCVDVELALKFATAKEPDASQLLKAWEKILEDDAVIRRWEAHLISLLGPVFAERGLEPLKYFSPIRR